MPATPAWGLLALLGAGLLLAGLPVALVPALLIALATLLFVLADTHRALVVLAFSIAPLGIVQVEVASVTINLPEALLLALCAKEAWVALVRGEHPARDFPWMGLALYLAAALVAVATGLLRENGVRAVFQDARQFTEYLLLFVLVAHRVESFAEARRIAGAFVAGAALLAAHGVVQRYSPIGIPGNQLLSDLVYHGAVRSGSFYGATPLGAIMVLAIGPVLGLLLGACGSARKAPSDWLPLPLGEGWGEGDSSPNSPFPKVCARKKDEHCCAWEGERTREPETGRDAWLAGGLRPLSRGPRRLVELLAGRDAWRAAPLLIALAVLLTAAIFTKTRASWMAIALLFAFFLVGIRKSRWMIVGATLGGLAFAALLGPELVERMSTLSFGKAERSLRMRVHYYETAAHIARAAPVFGLGWGCYFYQGDILANERYVQRARHERPVGAPKDATVHSAYLQILAKSGALGLGAFLFLLGGCTVACLRYCGKGCRGAPAYPLFLGVAASLSGYLFHAGLENFFQWPVMAQSFWLLMGLALVLARQLGDGRNTPSA